MRGAVKREKERLLGREGSIENHKRMKKGSCSCLDDWLGKGKGG